MPATQARRDGMRRERIASSMPVSEWIAEEAVRVAASDFAPEVAKMHANAMRLSRRFASEFRAFWGLGDEFEVKY